MEGEGVYQRLSVNISLSGYIPEGCKEDQIIKQVSHCIEHILKAASKYNNHNSGYNGEEMHLNLLTSPSITDCLAVEVSACNESNLICVLPYKPGNAVSEREISSEFISKAQSITYLDIDYTFPQLAKSALMKWMLDQSDLAIVLWDGRENSSGMDQWNMLQEAREKSLPCIWIDVFSPVDVYWFRNGYFEAMDTDHVKNYIDELFGLSEQRMNFLKELIINDNRMKPWWNWFYSYFIRVNKIVKQLVPEDPVMIIGASELNIPESSKKSRITLLDYFRTADKSAIENSENYRSSIYLRAIFPLFICFALTLGFYAETILGWIFGKGGLGIDNFWGWIAALGFGIHGILSSLMYELSKYSDKKGWHRKFIGQRYIAEALRLAVHFIPFGIPMGELSVSVYDNKIKKNPEVLHRLRAIIRSIDIPSVVYDRSFAEESLNNIEYLVDNQIAYHKNTLRQYESICGKLQTLADFIFFAGVGVIAARSIIQVILQFIVIPGARNEITNLSLIKSSANMFALLIPAIASHFALKLSYCNIEGLVDSSSNMVNNLVEIKKALENERRRENISFSNIYRLSKEMTQLVLGEVSNWYSQLTGKRITR